MIDHSSITIFLFESMIHLIKQHRRALIVWLERSRSTNPLHIPSRYKRLGDEGMDVALGKVLSVGAKFHHEYDFGTTTELTLKAISERRGKTSSKSIRLLARNDPPLITCGSCGKAATKVCSQCDYSHKSWLCDECAGEHECGEEMLLPVLNSPRIGMCAYTS